MAGIQNLLTGNTLEGSLLQREVQAAAQPPTLVEGDVAFYRRPPPVNPGTWGDLRLEEGADARLLTELQFLEGLGYAVKRDAGQWYVDLVAKERLYGHIGLFTAGGNKERNMAELAKMFATDVLPAYAAMMAGVTQTLPASTFQGIVARTQARDIDAGIRELQILIQAPVEEEEDEEGSNAGSVSSENTNANTESNTSSVSSDNTNANTESNASSVGSVVSE